MAQETQSEGAGPSAKAVSLGAPLRGRLGPYTLLKRLAVGGMAEVYLARQSGPEGFHKFFALKRVLDSCASSAEGITMFLDEARLAAQLNHPNIVQTHQLGEQDGSYYLAMEYLEGESFSALTKAFQQAGRAMPPAVAARLVASVAEGLDYAHRKTDLSGRALNIVHRDISPQNLMVTYEGTVKILDFGIARAASHMGHTREGHVRGKLAYMSPEQVMGGALDLRSDLFSLGCVFYELLTGARLLEGPDVAIMYTLMGPERLPSVRERVPDVAPELEAILTRLLQKNRAQRYPSAADAHRELETWLRSQPPLGSGELRALMAELFAERIAASRSLLEEADAASVQVATALTPEQRSATTPLLGPSPSGSSVREPPPGADAPTTLSEPPAERGPRTGRRRTVAAFVALALAGVLAGAVAFRSRAASSGAPHLRTTSAGRAAQVSPPPVLAAALVPAPSSVVSAASAPAVAKVEPAPGSPAEAPSSEAVAPAAGVTRRRRHPAATVRKGRLTLQTTPWTEVYLHGKSLGRTPLVELDLPAKTYDFRLVNKGEGVDVLAEIEVVENKVTVKKLGLR